MEATLLRTCALIAVLAALPVFSQPKPAQLKPSEVAALVKTALGDGIIPYAGARPVTADFKGDGQLDLAVIVDFNKKLQSWLKRGMVIHNLDSPSLAPMRPDSEQHFCFGLLILEGIRPERKTVFYGCFTGWHPVKGAQSAALDLDMESGTTLRLYNDGTRYRTRVVKKN